MQPRQLILLLLILPLFCRADDRNIFDAHGDVGAVLHVGSTELDTKAGTYTLTGSGANMWGTADAFQFDWKKIEGDAMLAADIAFPTAGGDPHRKACLMIRQSLDADSVYVDVALHGEGLTSLQFRETTGGATHEIQSNLSAPKRLCIEKRGRYVSMSLAAAGEELHYAGAAIRVEFKEPFYLGLAVCAHNKDRSETAVFSNVEFPPLHAPATKPAAYISTLETQTVGSTDRRVCFISDKRIEAPNWTHDGLSLIYNSGGRLYRIPAIGGTPQVIDTGFATRCNNDHALSPDGQTLAISDQSHADHQSRIYTVPVEGGTPKLVTENAPSYLHGWSPDGKTLAFCGQRDKEFDIYTIPAAGGAETRLTTAKGLDDGPEYSPDGQYIYFNSERSGTMQIWRMKADGTAQEQLTDDEFNNWFPHISPDSRRIVFISYDKDVTGHPENKDVTLRIMTIESKKIDVLAHLFGGQGTANVPNWSPDGKRIAFVTYRPAP